MPTRIASDSYAIRFSTITSESTPFVGAGRGMQESVPYSLRSAEEGAILVARDAGTRHAISATPASATAAAAKAMVSVGLTP